MANVVSVDILFESAELAERAFSITKDLIILKYTLKGTLWTAEYEKVESLSSRYFRSGGAADGADLLREHPNCALKWLRREGTRVVLERCADIQSPVGIFWPLDFFTQLCLTLSKCFPDTVFTAVCLHEETVSASIQLNRIVSDHGNMTYEEMWILDGEEFEEDDWTRAGKLELRDQDGRIIKPLRSMP